MLPSTVRAWNPSDGSRSEPSFSFIHRWNESYLTCGIGIVTTVSSPDHKTLSLLRLTLRGGGALLSQNDSASRHKLLGLELGAGLGTQKERKKGRKEGSLPCDAIVWSRS